MKKRIKHLSVLFLVMVSSFAVFADSFDDVVNALKASNVKDVSKYLNANVELTIADNEGMYSKQQAEVMIRNFISQHKPVNVTIQHRGSSAQGARYAIANYETAQGKFRVYIFMKDSGSGMLVHELRFEKE